MTIKERIKKWCTIDHIVDLSVDIFLMIWDVITSPVLIVVRVIRHFIGEWFTDKIKAGVRWIAHWFERKRAYRLEHGHGIWRTYWVLILLSPIILIGILITVAVTIFSMELSGAIFDELGGGGWWDDIDA
tara:strand:+ start:846 stop:1235 length:390 start_codon:yes stop_codon:yes gene_type:complete